MRFAVNIVGDLVRLMQAEVKAGEKAVTTAMRDAGTGLKTVWRAQINGRVQAGLYPIGKPAIFYFAGRIILDDGCQSEDGFGTIELHRARPSFTRPNTVALNKGGLRFRIQ